MNTKNISVAKDKIKRAKLSDFHGILSEEAADILERGIIESREKHKILHEKRIAHSKK